MLSEIFGYCQSTDVIFRLVWNPQNGMESAIGGMASAHRAAYLLFVGRTRRITQDTVKNGMHRGTAVYIIKAKALYIISLALYIINTQVLYITNLTEVAYHQP